MHARTLCHQEHRVRSLHRLPDCLRVRLVRLDDLDAPPLQRLGLVAILVPSHPAHVERPAGEQSVHNAATLGAGRAKYHHDLLALRPRASSRICSGRAMFRRQGTYVRHGSTGRECECSRRSQSLERCGSVRMSGQVQASRERPKMLAGAAFTLPIGSHRYSNAKKRYRDHDPIAFWSRCGAPARIAVLSQDAHTHQPHQICFDPCIFHGPPRVGNPN